MWRYLLEENTGAHQRCLDIGCGAGLHTVQLALNGAAHVHAIDMDERAVANTLDNAFRNGVDARVTAEVADLYPWVPQERYELVVASLPQVPIDPMLQLSSHRPADYWGRGLVDQVLAKLPGARQRGPGVDHIHVAALTRADRRAARRPGLDAKVVAWEVHETGGRALPAGQHLEAVERASDGFTLAIGDELLMVTYLLEIGLAAAGAGVALRSLSYRLSRAVAVRSGGEYLLIGRRGVIGRQAQLSACRGIRPSSVAVMRCFRSDRSLSRPRPSASR